MLKSNPSDSLLLRNYKKFLHEVEKDAVRVEECYSRGILASPVDGDLLSLYGKLIWETQERRESSQILLRPFCFCLSRRLHGAGILCSLHVGSRRGQLRRNQQ